MTGPFLSAAERPLTVASLIEAGYPRLAGHPAAPREKGALARGRRLPPSAGGAGERGNSPSVEAEPGAPARGSR